MHRKIAAGFCLGILSLTIACSSVLPPIPTNPPMPASKPTATGQAPSNPVGTIIASNPGSDYGYGDPVEVPNPGAAQTPAAGAPDEAFFQDHLATADLLVVNISNVTPAPSNQVYQGWIRNEDGSLISTGTLDVQDGAIHLEWTAPDGRNLIASVTGFLVSLSDAPGSDQLTGKVVFAGEMTPDQVALARNLFVSNSSDPVTPRNKAYATALVQQANLAGEHIKNAINAEAIGAAKERALHLEHVINIIEGTKGERFKDYDGDGVAQNPGDGFGVLAYAAELAAKLNQQQITTKTQEVLVALVGLEQEVIAILQNQPGAKSLSDLRSDFDKINQNLVLGLYNLSEQAVSFKVNPITTP